jgi:HTH-type transcriptional regulator, sugar sensing transcriptional regulator
MIFANKRDFMEKYFKELQKLGFSQYEFQVYTEVLKDFPITGYEISERSGVPRSMIYEVLEKLFKIGAVYTATLVLLTYVPLPAKELINRLRNNFEYFFKTIIKEKNFS